MEHSRDGHIQCVNDLCRICATLWRVSRKNKKNGDRTFNCDQLSGEIMIILGLNVRQETEDCFSKFLCLKCFKMIKDIMKHHREVTIVKAKTLLDNNKDKWCSYSTINITACKVIPYAHTDRASLEDFSRRKKHCKMLLQWKWGQQMLLITQMLQTKTF